MKRYVIWNPAKIEQDHSIRVETIDQLNVFEASHGEGYSEIVETPDIGEWVKAFEHFSRAISLVYGRV